MTGIQELAAAYGVRIELADLGDWGRVRLIAEYDPNEPVIRVNTCESSLTLRQAQGDMERAIAHELYHHREAIGEIPRIRDRAAREAAADAYADAVLRTRSMPCRAASGG
ncbi:MAG TPA: hypothetical protein VK665_06600 [Candidatus Elarobacter sp.]|nr:hypothetical protein [Candidatus Elarobacter sp.]